MIGLLAKKLISSVNAAVAHNVGNFGNGRGWGDSINWVPIVEAEKAASGKPIMLIVHRMTCPACQSLKARFAADTAIPELSRDFVMVNATPDDLHNFYNQYQGHHGHGLAAKLQPDGAYVPRIMFYYPSWGLLDLKGVYGNNKYYYLEAEQIRNQMKNCLSMLKLAR